MASKRNMRRRRCLGKKRYPSAADAARDVDKLRRRQPRDDISLYRCPNCGGIHVGHTPHRAPSPPPGGKRS